MFAPFRLDNNIRDLRYVDEFMKKAVHAYYNHYGYSKRFVWQHRVFKFAVRGDGSSVCYAEDNGVKQRRL